MSEQAPAIPVEDDLPEQMKVRREKRERLLAEGRQPYPVNVPHTHSLAQLRATYVDLPTDTATGDQVATGGRVIFIRNSPRSPPAQPGYGLAGCL